MGNKKGAERPWLDELGMMDCILYPKAPWDVMGCQNHLF